MRVKKRGLYGGIILSFFIFWALYVIVFLHVVENTSKKSFNAILVSMQTQIEKNISYSAKDLQLALSLCSHMDDISQQLSFMEQTYPGQPFYLLSPEGTVRDAEGNSRQFNLRGAHKRSVEQLGFAYVGIVSAPQQWDMVALLIPFFDTSDYLVTLYPTDAFYSRMFRDLSLNFEYLALYNEWGTLVYESEPEDGHMAQSVQEDAVNHASRQTMSIEKVGFAQKYNVYVPIIQPEGWFLGARVHAAQALPLYSGVLNISILVLVVWMLIIAAIISLDLYNDRERRRETHRANRIDALTGLANTTGMEHVVMECFRDKSMKGMCLVFIDIADFHRFNSMFGYVMGDTLLRVVADVIKGHYRAGTRMSGDVFACVDITSPSTAQDMQHRIYEAIDREMGKQYSQMINFRFGIYPILEECLSFRDIYDGALLALRDAKLSREQREVVYSSQVQQSADTRRNIEINMLHALSTEEYLVYIQPKFRVADGSCCGGEALVRWQSEQMGFMCPGQFIPLFEKNGFIVELDFYMLENVLNVIRAHIKSGKAVHPLSVNQSRVTITFPNYMERLENLAENYKDVPREYVELEITESMLEDNREIVVPLIQKIKALGFRVALDDFGSGFSSLNTLRELPVDVLKIDKEFLNESDTYDRSSKIIRNIIYMTKEIDIGIVCEGVETKAQMEFLQQAGCEVVQGYYFSKAIPLSEYEAKYMDK